MNIHRVLSCIGYGAALGAVAYQFAHGHVLKGIVFCMLATAGHFIGKGLAK